MESIPGDGVILHGPSEEVLKAVKITGQIPVVRDAALPLFESEE